jgi:isocitrate lyase
MRAYGELIQEPEMDAKVDVVTHQKWSGANYVVSSAFPLFREV